MASRLEFRTGSGEGSNDSDVTFTEWLAGLKSRGSNLLVTGDVPRETSAEFSRTLFGEGRRTRVLALTDPTALDADAHLPVPSDDPNARVIDRRVDRRATAASGITAASEFDRETLRTEVISAIGRYDVEVGGFDPAELRLGVDSVEALSGGDDLVTLEQFLRGLTAVVRGSSGMAHYHLRLPDDDSLVDDLSPLFDARIELRKRPGRAEQRWHVPALGETTYWVELS
ncbi:DUF7504 family protein [Haladaptatus salinisoli]|uniref:DUF7504 family protein n=1 Tax=Haladaptatus salinisoli TaxID=2884876 RepID=UPI001D0A86E8|nr:hypothetical protein [Haladaptatus salinisoli]